MEENITLSELNGRIKQALQESFPEPIWLVAGIGELTQNRAGHCYLELVEKEAANDAIKARARGTIWSWQYRFIKPFFESMTGQTLQAGIKILISASVEFHEVYGYSLNIKDIDPSYTLGDMARKRQETIDRLTKDGIIDMNKSLDLPEIPSRIAVISSPTAAGYEDFVNQLENNERGFFFSIKLFPALMQGNDAPRSIINALDSINDQEDDFDVVVIIRGGGSQLDLACFDDYDLASNIAQFPLPVLTGIGHEKDDSIADLVANTRLKTPTAVAEFLIDLYEQVYTTIEDLRAQFQKRIVLLLNNENQRLDQNIRLLRPIFKASLEQKISQFRNLCNKFEPQIKQSISNNRHLLESISAQSKHLVKVRMKDHAHSLQIFDGKIKILGNQRLKRMKFEQEQLERKFSQAIMMHLQKQQEKIHWMEKNAQLVDPKNILKRGYSITTIQNKSIRNALEVKKGDQIETLLFDGKITSTIK